MMILNLLICVIIMVLICLIVYLILLVILILMRLYLTFSYIHVLLLLLLLLLTDLLLLLLLWIGMSIVIMQISKYLSYRRKWTLLIEWGIIKYIRYLLKVHVFKSFLTNFDFMKISLMYTPFASLPKSLLAAINFADKRFFSCVRVGVFYQVLLQGKLFMALMTLELFFCFMLFHVPLETILSFKLVFAIYDVAHK